MNKQYSLQTLKALAQVVELSISEEYWPSVAANFQRTVRIWHILEAFTYPNLSVNDSDKSGNIDRYNDAAKQ
ncbi:MAG: DUF4089 domain-containing protein [Cyanobacteria bacterium P01_H01_bin.15]